jgi:hypothetical protein
MDNATKVKIFEAARTELMRQSLDTFVDGGVSVAWQRSLL